MVEKRELGGLASDAYEQSIAEINQFNDAIEGQNNRLGLLDEIDDEDFRSLAWSGLLEEQQETFERMLDSASQVPYAEIGLRSLEISTRLGEISTKLTIADSTTEKYRRMAELSAQIAPKNAEAAARLAEMKTESAKLEAEEYRNQIEQLQIEEARIVAIGAAWAVPRVIALRDRRVEQNPRREMIEESLERKDQEAILDSVLWGVYEYAERNGAFRVEEMRRVVPALSQLSEAEYGYFKTHFAELRERISAKLEQRGVQTDWRVSGKARGTRYELIFSTKPAGLQDEGSVQRAAGTSTDLDSSGVVSAQPDSAGQLQAAPQRPIIRPMITHELNAEQLAQVPLVQSLIVRINNLLKLNDVPSLKRTYLARELSNQMGMEMEDVALLLSDLLKAGLLYENGHTKGTKLLTTIAPKPSNAAAVPGASPEQAAGHYSREQDQEVQIREDVEVATAVLFALGELQHASQGLVIRELLKGPSLANKRSEDCRRSIRRMQATGIITITKSKRTGGPHSTRMELPVVKFATQELKKQWKGSPHTLITELTRRLEALAKDAES